MRDECCAKCRFFGFDPNAERVLEFDGVCRRHAPPWEYGYLSDWCGDFSEDQKWLLKKGMKEAYENIIEEMYL